MKNPHDPSDIDLTAAVEELMDALDREYPDPVDVFEDELARRLGCVPHPSCSYEDWRRQRVRLIEAAEPGEELADFRRQAGESIGAQVELLQALELADLQRQAGELIRAQVKGPQALELADFRRQAGESIGAQVQRLQALQLADLGRQAGELVGYQIERMQALELKKPSGYCLKSAVAEAETDDSLRLVENVSQVPKAL